MASVHLHGVGAAWPSSAPLFDSVSLSLEGGFYGLVGANGAGKTTLLSVIAGLLAPQEGRVSMSPPDALVAYCRQEVSAADEDIGRLAAREDGEATALFGRLSLSPESLSRWSTLSPGERKRWQVAAALAREPDVLLLDEPTNHLDGEAKKQLLGALRRFTGLGVIISHDRQVLDALTWSTIRVHQGAVTLWPGRFSEARALWEEAREAELSAADAARSRVRRAESQLDTAQRAQAGAARNVSARKRMKNKNDSDARGILATNKAQWAASKAGRAASNARTELSRAQAAVPVVERDRAAGATLYAAYERAPHAHIFHINEAELRRGEEVILRDLRVTVSRDDRVRIEGPNGAGKTTLLEALLASHSRAERTLYLPQELSDQAIRDLLALTRALDPAARGRLLSIFAALGSDPACLLRRDAGPLSPGEARKLALAEALRRQVWALVLDEPTNHLDLPSIERLEEALEAYPGAIVLVTHDDAFARRLTTRSLHVDGGSVR